MLLQNHFRLWNSNMKVPNLGTLAIELSNAAHSVWNPVSILTTDESVFEWNGRGCPVRHYIPRKPHPNGLLAYCMCTWTHVDGCKLPVMLECEPHYRPDQEDISAQSAMIKLLERFSQVPTSSFPQS